jgi:hypothetical protein
MRVREIYEGSLLPVMFLYEVLYFGELNLELQGDWRVHVASIVSGGCSAEWVREKASLRPHHASPFSLCELALKHRCITDVNMTS